MKAYILFAILALAGCGEDPVEEAESEAKADGKAMLAKFLDLVKKYEKTAKYVPGFERFVKKCGKS